MASEFGISSDDVITLLRQMDVPVRSHLSLLTDDQVARIRARWEREKRVRAEKQTAPPTRRRRGTAAPAPTAAAPATPASAEASGIRRRRRPADVAGDAGIATTEEHEIEIATPDNGEVDHVVTVDHEPEVPSAPVIDTREPDETTAIDVAPAAPPAAPQAPPVVAAPPAPPRADTADRAPAFGEPPQSQRPAAQTSAPASA